MTCVILAQYTNLSCHHGTVLLQVHFIIASCENMVAGKGLRPGDVLTAASGKTVEVNK
jgi:leucyl aminopeptidase